MELDEETPASIKKGGTYLDPAEAEAKIAAGRQPGQELSSPESSARTRPGCHARKTVLFGVMSIWVHV